MSTLRRGLKPSLPDDVALLDRPRIVRQVNLLLDAGKDGAALRSAETFQIVLRMVCQRGLHSFQSDGRAQAPEALKVRETGAERAPLSEPLTDDEIRALWTATAVPTSFHNLVRLCLATGLRKGEAARLRWSDIDFKAGKIAVPGAHTKTGTPHMVALSSLSRLILSQVPRRVGVAPLPIRPCRGRRADVLVGLDTIGQAGLQGFRHPRPQDAHAEKDVSYEAVGGRSAGGCE